MGGGGRGQQDTSREAARAREPLAFLEPLENRGRGEEGPGGEGWASGLL